jgi:hypothetical protein
VLIEGKWRFARDPREELLHPIHRLHIMITNEGEIEQRSQRKLVAQHGGGRWPSAPQPRFRPFGLVVGHHATPRDRVKDRVARNSRETKVDDRHPPCAVDQHVLRMDVSMNDASLMQHRVGVDQSHRQAQQHRA